MKQKDTRITFYNPMTDYDSVTKIPRMPLGLIAVAAACNANDYYMITVVDDDLRHDDEGFAERIAATEPDVVGLTTWMGGFPDIGHLREVLPAQVPIVVGGALASVVPDFHLKQGADYVIIGNGQDSFVRLLRALEDKKGLESIPGLAWQGGRNAVRGQVPDSVCYTYGYHYFNMEEYFRRWPSGKKGAMIVCASGCPGNCPFCSPDYRSCYLPRPIAEIGPELLRMAGHGVEELYIADATFTHSLFHMREVCQSLAFNKMRWFCESRPDSIDEEKCQVMKKSGCYLTLLGMESASDAISSELTGGKGRRITLQAVKMLRDHGIDAGVFVLFGLPGETADTIRETLDFIAEMGVKASPNVLFPVPGTPIWQMAQEKGVLPPLGEYLIRLNEYNKRNRAYVSVPGMCEATENEIIAAVHAVWQHNENLGGQRI